MKRGVVISLGGSLIIPEKVNFSFLDKFKKILRRHYKNYKFVIVCGGGKIAREYIDALRKEARSKEELMKAGVRTTRMNALFLMQFFGKEANDKIPASMNDVKNALAKNDVVICGALRHEKEATSDTTAAKLAQYFKTEFINITNVAGLFNKDPIKNKNAKLIKKISWEAFQKIANKVRFEAGQHFVLDQNAANLIKKHKIKTYIINDNPKNLDNLLKHKNFIGTTIAFS